jgi:hypothetical protein
MTIGTVLLLLNVKCGIYVIIRNNLNFQSVSKFRRWSMLTGRDNLHFRGIWPSVYKKLTELHAKRQDFLLSLWRLRTFLSHSFQKASMKGINKLFFYVWGIRICSEKTQQFLTFVWAQNAWLQRTLRAQPTKYGGWGLPSDHSLNAYMYKQANTHINIHNTYLIYTLKYAISLYNIAQFGMQLDN